MPALLLLLRLEFIELVEAHGLAAAGPVADGRVAGCEAASPASTARFHSLPSAASRRRSVTFGPSTVTAVKASAGRVHGYHVYNSNTTDAFLHFYDIASGSVTVGTSTRLRTLWIPAGGAIDSLFAVPITFGTAISTAATTTITGSTTPTTGLLVDVDFI